MAALTNRARRGAGGGVAGSRNYRVLCYYTEALYELLAATTAKAKTQLIALEEDGVECMSCTETAKLIHFSSSKFLFQHEYFGGYSVNIYSDKLNYPWELWLSLNLVTSWLFSE